MSRRGEYTGKIEETIYPGFYFKLEGNYFDSYEQYQLSQNFGGTFFDDPEVGMCLDLSGRMKGFEFTAIDTPIYINYQDFTFDCLVKFNSIASDQDVLLSAMSTLASNFAFTIFSFSAWTTYLNPILSSREKTGSQYNPVNILSTTRLSILEWYKISIVRKDGYVTIFINDEIDTPAQLFNENIWNEYTPYFAIGRYANNYNPAGRSIDAFIKNVRLIIGTALYV